MNKLRVSFAVGDYDRTRPLVDGEVQIDGVDPVFAVLGPEEMFFRAFRHAEFDVSELSLSSFALRTARGDCPYVGVPVFLSRAFRHTSIHIRTDRGIKAPADLKGRRVGTPEYQLTANVWARALLEDEYGVKPSDVTWVQGGIEDPGRPEKVALDLPAGVRMERAPDGATLSQMLADGEIDAMVSPRAPSCWDHGDPNVGWLFPDPMAAAQDYFRRTGIFPIMHVLGLRRELAEAQPWLPATLLKAFTASKEAALKKLGDTSATKVTLPFLEEQLHAVRALMGEDYWGYGLEAGRVTLDNFLHHHHAQGLSPRRLTPEELFVPSTFEVMKI